MACGAGLLVDGCKRIWMCARKKGGCGPSMARGSSGTCSPKSSGNGTSTRLPKRWCCAQFASRAGGLETAGVGAGRWYQSCLGSWSSRTRIPQRVHSPTAWNYVWCLGVYSSNQGAACAVGRVGSAAEGTFFWPMMPIIEVVVVAPSLQESLTLYDDFLIFARYEGQHFRRTNGQSAASVFLLLSC